MNMNPSQHPESPDLDAYFTCIGYAGPRRPTLSVLNAITHAHACSIPFENLDVLLGRPIRLDIDSIFNKLVHARRGGYCFEQNGLLLHVLSAVGFRVAPISARVRLQRPRDFVPPRTHAFLRVEIEGESWLTDVGMGGVSLTGAIRFDSNDAQVTPHETRRISREGSRYFHQVLFDGNWTDACEFTLEEMPPIDREVANWYTSTHPESHFKNQLIVALAAPDGVRITMHNDEFSVRGRDGRAEKRCIGSNRERLLLLAERFGLNFPEDVIFSIEE